MKQSIAGLQRVAVLGLFLLVLAACGNTSASSTTTTTTGNSTAATSGNSASGAVKITLGAYTSPREAYAKIIPQFKQAWKAQSGQDVTFEESYLGSGAQSRAIVDGFDADVAALSLEADIDSITKAGLITHDWKAGPNHGMVSNSVVAFAVRPGNPKGIHDWADLAKPGLNVLTPNPRTSGGAQWNIMALYGAAIRGNVAGVAKDDQNGAVQFLKQVLKNVSVMDKGARESMTTFEKGIGDVAISYENEVFIAQHSGEKVDLVLPRSSILIETPVALVDSYVNKHGNRAAVEAFINFLYTSAAQQIFADDGMRAVEPTVAKASASKYPQIPDQFTIADLGGWKDVTPRFFGDDGTYTKVVAEVQK